MACCRPRRRDVVESSHGDSTTRTQDPSRNKPFNKKTDHDDILSDVTKCRVVASALIANIRSHGGLKREGVFRIPGSSLAVASAHERFASGEDAPEVVCRDLFSLSDDEDGVDAAASLFKKWVKLAYPVSRATLVRAARGEESLIEDAGASPLFEFLADVAADADTNRMPARNLATVFAPLYLDDDDDNDASAQNVNGRLQNGRNRRQRNDGKAASQRVARQPAADPADFVKNALAPVIDAFSKLILLYQARRFRPQVDLRSSNADGPTAFAASTGNMRALDDDDDTDGTARDADVATTGRPLKTKRQSRHTENDPLADLAAQGLVAHVDDSPAAEETTGGLNNDVQRSHLPIGRDAGTSRAVHNDDDDDDDMRRLSFPMCGCVF